MFDARKFLNANFSARTSSVSVPALAQFFEDDTPEWKVRGLTGDEVARSGEAVKQNRDIAGIAEGLVSADAKEKAQRIRELVGIGDDVPDDIAKRISMLVMGSVSPECDQETAVRLKDCYPIEFYQVTTEILRLTGLGKDPGKPKASCAIQE